MREACPNLTQFFGSRVVHHSCLPENLGFDEAVSIPVVWITAHYCFFQAQLQSMQDVLVHSAAGGVGLISLEWSMRARAAATFTTASGVAKHAVLRSRSVAHSASSRNADACAAGLSSLRQSHRVHCVINALSDDFIPLSLGLLASRGAYLEIGKNSIWSLSRSIAAAVSVTFVAVAVDEGCRSCPGWNNDAWWFQFEILHLSTQVQAGEVTPLLHEAVNFEVGALQAALRLLQRGANLGKIVVQVGQRQSAQVARKYSLQNSEPSLLVEMETMETHSNVRRAPLRGVDLGSLIHLGIANSGVAELELHDPERFNTMCVRSRFHAAMMERVMLL